MDGEAHDDQGPLSRFGTPKPFVATEFSAYNGMMAAHIVWAPDGQLVYVGESGNTGRRLRQHLSGDREASVLHDQVGRVLDIELGRTATRDEIREWLERCTFAVSPTNDPASLKAAVMDASGPRFNTIRPGGEVAGSADAWRSLPLHFAEVLDALASPDRENAVRATRELVTRRIPAALAQILPTTFAVRGSVGMGDVADVPWVGVFPASDPDAKRGVYLVFLFAHDGSRTYLSLIQGTEGVEGGASVLRKRASDVRDALPADDVLTTIDLRSLNQRPKRYEAGTIYAVEYPVGDSISADRIRSDLERMVGLLNSVDTTALGLDQLTEPQHLLVKWSVERNPRTLELHREIAAERGSVWWGNFANTEGSTAMSAARIERLRAQLDAGVPTRCALYRAGEVWLTTLRAITADPAQVEVDLLPAYYRPEQCNLFYLLGDFEQVPPSWAVDNVLLASNPDPERVAGALGNQTTPLLVYFRRRATTPHRAADIRPERASETLGLDWLVRETLWERADLEDMIDAVNDRRQIILAGPPGTGKTHVATHLARFLTQDVPLAHELVQFHPSYGYEDFVEGLRPVPHANTVTFEPVPGRIMRLVDRMSDAADQPHVLIIDEMNRANLPRVFGELMYLMEYRERGEPVQLLYRDNFTLPERLALIGTMNTADRSIRVLDVALRRRFEVFECAPDPQILGRYYSTRSCSVDALGEGFVALNAWLTERLDRHHTVGHTFFMRDGFTPARLRAVWKRQLLPLFDDYFFDQPTLVNDLRIEQFWPSVADDAAH